MDRPGKFLDALGQHMTPPDVARLLASELPSAIEAAIDLAVGDGALLKAVRQRWPSARAYGIDCDANRLQQASSFGKKVRLFHGDGLAGRLPDIRLPGDGRTAWVGNPPFLAADPDEEHAHWQAQAFPEVNSRHGLRRLEVSFLARALVEARKRGAVVAMLMPSPFASGVLYAPYRASLANNYGLRSVVTIEDTRYRRTEASTVLLVVDTRVSESTRVSISRYNQTIGKKLLYRGRICPGDRLDAGYWTAIELHRSCAPKLADIGVDVTRGRYCNADAQRRQHRVLHTTDLSRHHGATIELPNVSPGHFPAEDVLAETGDILLSRTGSRVRWEPVVVTAGVAPITDHVLRIRSPQLVREQVARSFMHPAFPTWLESVTKGVCASVITKRELLQMPVFAA